MRLRRDRFWVDAGLGGQPTMQLARRAPLLVALSLLTSAATAHAECAWVLWQQQGEISPGGAMSSSDWTWLTAEATSTEAECRQRRRASTPRSVRKTRTATRP